MARRLAVVEGFFWAWQGVVLRSKLRRATTGLGAAWAFAASVGGCLLGMTHTTHWRLLRLAGRLLLGHSVRWVRRSVAARSAALVDFGFGFFASGDQGGPESLPFAAWAADF